MHKNWLNMVRKYFQGRLRAKSKNIYIILIRLLLCNGSDYTLPR